METKTKKTLSLINPYDLNKSGDSDDDDDSYPFRGINNDQSSYDDYKSGDDVDNDYKFNRFNNVCTGKTHGELDKEIGEIRIEIGKLGKYKNEIIENKDKHDNTYLEEQLWTIKKITESKLAQINLCQSKIDNIREKEKIKLLRAKLEMLNTQIKELETKEENQNIFEGVTSVINSALYKDFETLKKTILKRNADVKRVNDRIEKLRFDIYNKNIMEQKKYREIRNKYNIPTKYNTYYGGKTRCRRTKCKGKRLSRGTRRAKN
jgi:hypothetical protein